MNPADPGHPVIPRDWQEAEKPCSRGKAMDHEPTFPKTLSRISTVQEIGVEDCHLDCVSLAVVGFFALLVNIVLPGPHGESLIGGGGKTQQALPKMPSADEGPTLLGTARTW